MAVTYNFVSFLFFIFCLFSLSLSNSDFNALLYFKASVSDPSNSLSSWLNSTHPCARSWFGVTCNPSTHRVIKLVLENLNLSGPVEPLNRLTHLRVLSLKNNFLYSSNLNLSSCPHLKNIYLSHNRFQGMFPPGVSNIRRLHRLDLSYNHFTGEIPMTELSRLPTLLTLRLEANSFTGTLDIANSISLSVTDFNVSNNKLSGEIPSWMSRFPMSSFGGNENLCGRPLASNCSNRTAESVAERSSPRRLRDIVVLVIVLFDVVAIVAAVVTIALCCYKRKRNRCGGGFHNEMQMKHGTHHNYNGRYSGEEEDEMVLFEGCQKGFTKVGDLLKASAELLGKGCVGTTYKVAMEGGDVVVKRIRERKKKKEVEEWLSVIGGLRHCNIVNLRAYCNAKDELLLVYDFLPNGSLHSLLHGDRGPGRTPLDWTTRLKLASDSAKGLAFLHGYDKVRLFHGHLSSSNVVVDQLGKACISDIGIHQLLHTPSLLISNVYKAPELKANNGSSCSQRKYTQKCDVYSFGVVLLEILTGKMATGDGESSVVSWVQRTWAEENAWEVFDFELIRDKEMEEEMRALLQVAGLCLSPLPKDRPKMSLVHKMIEDIRTKGSIDGGNSFMNNLSSDSSPTLSETTIN